MKSVFIQSGVHANRLFVVPETVDIYAFNRSEHDPLPSMKQPENIVKFLSVFKWEHRKGWDVLLKAFLGLLKHAPERENSSPALPTKTSKSTEAKESMLYVLASTYHNKADFHMKVQEFLKKNMSCSEVIRQLRARFQQGETLSYYLRGYDFGDSWWCVDFEDTHFDDLTPQTDSSRLKFQIRPTLKQLYQFGVVRPLNHLEQTGDEDWLQNVVHEPILGHEPNVDALDDIHDVQSPASNVLNGDGALAFCKNIPVKEYEDVLLVRVNRNGGIVHVPVRRRRYGKLPALRLLTGIPQTDLPKVYRSVDALVAPSRGEGWGRPHSEAMAMGVPVVATNWSGPTEFMTPSNSYLLPYTHLAPIQQGAFQGHYQAEPCTHSLSRLMHRIIINQTEAAEKGTQAQDTMRTSFGPTRIRNIINNNIRRILNTRRPNHSRLKEDL
eukprot:gb/GECG01013805.1/.p1 GENE.gb/GECG01013805.1/~~gb/GECG01013805.1/.p1  ORF type:complete len:439 (+),score=33.89 gb/GECG01013805.1/:1-1317(+)